MTQLSSHPAHPLLFSSKLSAVHLLLTFFSNLICTLNASPSSHEMRFLAIVSVFFAVTQVAFAAPVSLAFRSDVITQPLQERGVFTKVGGHLDRVVAQSKNKGKGVAQSVRQTHRNIGTGVKEGLRHGLTTFKNLNGNTQKPKAPKQQQSKALNQQPKALNQQPHAPKPPRIAFPTPQLHGI
ncbi:hypothetical protein K439DRAFT_1633639 [Ramaria rubella]|nr:hypothetical protein K439DRAFT_1633639 [Ramaria rubella]